MCIRDSSLSLSLPPSPLSLRYRQDVCGNELMAPCRHHRVWYPQVSIVHLLFDVLAFKNDISFWRDLQVPSYYPVLYTPYILFRTTLSYPFLYSPTHRDTVLSYACPTPSLAPPSLLSYALSMHLSVLTPPFGLKKRLPRESPYAPS
eukprot:243336-Rhodomonas_salina.1